MNSLSENYFWLGILSSSLFVLSFGQLIYQIRKRTLKKIDYLYATRALFFGMVAVPNFELAYVWQASIDTFIKYRTLETQLSQLSYFVIALLFGVLMIFMVLTRRSMRVAWFNPLDKKPIALSEAFQGGTTPYLLLPTTIKTQVNWQSTRIAFFLLFIVLEAILIISFATTIGWQWSIAVAIQGILLTIFALLFMIVLAGREQILITAENLCLKTGVSSKKIRWEDVRFFALLKDNTIEVSSPKKTIRLTRFGESSGFKPVTSYAEYTQQMDALLVTIAAHTHLPLFDLRNRTPF